MVIRGSSYAEPESDSNRPALGSRRGRIHELAAAVYSPLGRTNQRLLARSGKFKQSELPRGQLPSTRHSPPSPPYLQIPSLMSQPGENAPRKRSLVAQHQFNLLILKDINFTHTWYALCDALREKLSGLTVV